MNIEIKKSISEACSEKMTSIYKKMRMRTFFRNYRKDILNDLLKVKEHLNIRLMNFLVFLSLDSDEIIADEAGFIIHEMLDSLSCKELKLLESFYRNSYYIYELDLRINENELANTKSKILRNKYRDDLLCIMTMSGNGYIREFSIKHLAFSSHKHKLAFLILRLNDWVENVRSSALETLYINISKESNFEPLLEVLPIFDAIENWSRLDSNKLRVKLNIVLLDPKNRQKISDKYYHTKDNKIKRSLIEVLLNDVNELDKTLKVGLKSKDPIIARKCISVVMQNRYGFDIVELVKVMIISKSTICKVAGLEHLAKVPDELYQRKVLNKFLFDKSNQVREIARRKLLESDSTFSAVEFYRSFIGGSSHFNRYAIIGFGEVCTISEYAYIESLHLTQDINIKAVTIRILLNLDPVRSKDLVLDMLCSDNAIDSKRVRKYLSSPQKFSFYAVEASEIIDFIDFKEHVYINILHLMRYAPKWLSIIVYLKVLNNNSEKINEVTLSALEKWIARFNRSFLNPTTEVIQEYENLLSLKENFILSKFLKELQWILKTQKHGV